MSAVGLAQLIERLPAGRARARYERLLQSTDGTVLTISVAYCDQPLWLVERQEQAGHLAAQGIPRWRIWTLRELQDFLGSVCSLAEAAQALVSK